MRRKILYSMFCSCLLTIGASIVFSACNDDNNDIISNLPPPEIIYISAGDYLMEVDNMTGTAHYDERHNAWYIEDAQLNRYYILPLTETSYDEIKRLLSDKIQVQFKGKVYELNEELRKNDETFSALKDINLYVLVAPNYSIWKN